LRLSQLRELIGRIPIAEQVVGRERWEEWFPNVLHETRFREVTFHRKNFDVLGRRIRTFTTQNNPLIGSLCPK